MICFFVKVAFKLMINVHHDKQNQSWVGSQLSYFNLENSVPYRIRSPQLSKMGWATETPLRVRPSARIHPVSCACLDAHVCKRMSLTLCFALKSWIQLNFPLLQHEDAIIVFFMIFPFEPPIIFKKKPWFRWAHVFCFMHVRKQIEGI